MVCRTAFTQIRPNIVGDLNREPTVWEIIFEYYARHVQDHDTARRLTNQYLSSWGREYDRQSFQEDS
jgi:hypothetical protein